MTEVNTSLASILLSEFVGWADLEDDLPDLCPDWNPTPETYQADLEAFTRKHARLKAEDLHPEAVDLVKAAMRWVMVERPEAAKPIMGALLFAIELPDPPVLLWVWAWEGAFGDEPWRIEGETFEHGSFENLTPWVSKRAWEHRPYFLPPPQDIRPSET